MTFINQTIAINIYLKMPVSTLSTLSRTFKTSLEVMNLPEKGKKKCSLSSHSKMDCKKGNMFSQGSTGDLQKLVIF